MTNWIAAESTAKCHGGLITRVQLLDAGIADRSLTRAVGQGRLVRVLSKVYRFAMTPDTWDLRAQAALLSSRPGDALSHASAAVVWGLSGYERRNATVIHLSQHDRRGRRRLGTGYELHRPTRAFVPFLLNGFPVTRLARTFVDLAAELEEPELEQVLDRAYLRRPRLERWLQDELRPLDPKSVPGVGVLQRLLKVRRGVAVESPLETRVRRFVRSRDVEEPTYQLEIHDEQGRIMRVDAAWEGHRIALHTDSYQWHGDRRTFDDDASKRRRLVAAGWASVAVTSTDLESDRWFQSIERMLHDRAPQRSFFGFTETRALDPRERGNARRGSSGGPGAAWPGAGW